MSPQTGPDLTGAGYPISRPLTSLLGGASNAAQPNYGVRTNLDYGLGLQWVDSGAGNITGGTALSVAVPVVPGDVITKVTYLQGVGAASNISHSWAALYAGTGASPALIAQTPDYTASYANIGAGQPASVAGNIVATGSSQPMTYTFSSPVTITSLNAPFGFIYVSNSMTVASGSISTIVSGSVSTLAGSALRLFGQSTTPNFFAAAHGTALGSVAEATLGTSSAAVARSPAPIVFLW